MLHKLKLTFRCLQEPVYHHLAFDVFQLLFAYRIADELPFDAPCRLGTDVESVLSEYAALNAGKRLIDPEAVAAKVAWLCEPGQAGTSGDVIVIE